MRQLVVGEQVQTFPRRSPLMFSSCSGAPLNGWFESGRAANLILVFLAHNPATGDQAQANDNGDRAKLARIGHYSTDPARLHQLYRPLAKDVKANAKLEELL